MKGETVIGVVFGFFWLALLLGLIYCVISIFVYSRSYGIRKSETYSWLRFMADKQLRKLYAVLRMSPNQMCVIERADALRSQVHSQIFLLHDMRGLLDTIDKIPNDLKIGSHRMPGGVLVAVAQTKADLRSDDPDTKILQLRFSNYFNGVQRHHKHMEFVAKSWIKDDAILDKLAAINAIGWPTILALFYKAVPPLFLGVVYWVMSL